MPRIISPTAPLLRPCLNHPRANGVSPQTSRWFTVQTRPSGPSNSLLLVETHLHRRQPVYHSILSCSAQHRGYRNKHLPKKRGILKLKNDHERMKIIERNNAKRSSFDAIIQRLTEREEENDGRNMSADTLEQVKSSAMDDLGCIPGTAIVITRSWWPSLLQEPKKRARMEYLLLKSRFRDAMGILIASFSLGWRNLFNRRFSRADARQAAVALHHQMYKTLAEGETRDLDTLALAGLRNQMRTQIAQRPPGRSYQWDRRNVRAKLLSHRVSALPWQLGGGRENVYLRQAVVRIRSWQTLVPTLNGAELQRSEEDAGTPQVADGETKGDFDELVVVQRRASESGDEPWRVWGLVSESKEEDWEDVEDPEGAYERNEQRRFEATKEAFQKKRRR